MANKSNREAIEKLRELIKGIDIAMFTTVDEDGTLRSRPMGTQEAEFDGDLWFITSVDTGKVPEIQKEQQVNVSYGDPGSHRYVSVSGKATVIDDRAKVEEFWQPIYKAYFPEGKDDPKLRVIKVVVEKAEYWESPGGIIPTVIAFARAMLGDENVDIGENEKLTLKN